MENKKTFTEADLVSFGNFILSKMRRKFIRKEKDKIYHADLMNWQDLNK